MRHVETEHSCHEAARKYDVSPSLVINLVALWRETGSVEPCRRGGYRHSKLNEHRAFILSQVERQSGITMPELAAVLAEAKGVDVDPSHAGALYSSPPASALKKTLQTSEQDRPDVAKARAEWVEGRQPLMAQAQNRLVFVDETGTSTKMTRARGRSPKGGGLIAKAYDSRAIEDILHGNETRVWGDSAYQGQREAIRTAAPQTQDFTHHRGNRALALSDEEMAKNRTKSRVRAHVEHPFRILKCVFGNRKIC